MDLEIEELHIWHISLIQSQATIETLANHLDENEKAKAEKFRFKTDRLNYIISHGAGREILAEYLDCLPSVIQFEENDYGKPFLRENKKKIYFNLSHSHEIALLAVSKKRQVGVDIEFIRTNFEEINIVEQIFSTPEIETLQSLPKNLKTKAFFDCWTRKEAFIKAVGQGLSFPLKEFSVTFSPFEEARLSLENIFLKTESWRLIKLNVADNYAAAAAIEAKKTETKLFLWNYCSNSI